jgi:uncharacterized protein (TIGR00296 family)
MLTEKQGKDLIKFARQAITSKFKNKRAKRLLDKDFDENRGVFVTLKKDGKLRGCIGFPEPILPLIDAVEKASLAAAFGDPRFEPLKESELKELNIELSVLTKPKLLEAKTPRGYIKKIKIGKHGLIVRRQLYSGLLLPQVATEHKMDAKGFLSHTCMKAGLPPDTWLDQETKVYTFECQIFHE